MESEGTNGEWSGLNRRKRSAAVSVTTEAALSLTPLFLTPSPQSLPLLSSPPPRQATVYISYSYPLSSLSLSLSLLRSTLIRRKSLSRRRRINGAEIPARGQWCVNGGWSGRERAREPSSMSSEAVFGKDQKKENGVQALQISTPVRNSDELHSIFP